MCAGQYYFPCLRDQKLKRGKNQQDINRWLSRECKTGSKNGNQRNYWQMRWNKEFNKEAVFVWKPFCSFYFFRYRQTNQWLFYKIYHRIVVRFLASLIHWLHFPCFLSHIKHHLTYMRINLVWTLAVGEYSLGVLTSLGDCLDLWLNRNM